MSAQLPPFMVGWGEVRQVFAPATHAVALGLLLENLRSISLVQCILAIQLPKELLFRIWGAGPREGFVLIPPSTSTTERINGTVLDAFERTT